MYYSPDRLTSELLGGLRPPLRMTVNEVAAQHVHIAGDGVSTVKWSPDVAPYMIEPMRMITDRGTQAIIVVGPARSSKTASLTECVLAHQMYTGRGDTMISEPTEERARMFGKVRYPRMVKSSAALKGKISQKHNDDAIHEKILVNGSIIRFRWHSASSLSGDSYQTVVFPDYDRREDDVEGEGSKFLMGLKRIETSMSSGICIAESSPGFNVNVTEWEQRQRDGLITKHEIPPCEGISKYYNQGTRKKLYWRCPHCNEWTRPDMEFLKMYENGPHLACEVCAGLIPSSEKKRLNIGCDWFGDDGKVTNQRWQSYWFEGPAAAFQTWDSILMKTASAIGSYESLKSQDMTKALNDWKLVVNTDHGRPFVPPKVDDSRPVGELAGRVENYERGIVPAGVKFIVAAIDQQKNRFVVQIIGFGVDRETWLIDRYNMSESQRVGPDGKKLRMEPFAIQEDWTELKKVFTRAYDGFVPAKVWIDMGGLDKATQHADAFARMIRGEPYFHKLVLGRGERRAGGEVVRIAEAKGMGRIMPVHLCDTSRIGQEFMKMLDRPTQGPNYVHIPRWITANSEWFLNELTSMIWDGKGFKKKAEKINNEGYDLFIYALALYKILQADRIDWNNAPNWAVRLGRPDAAKQSTNWLAQAAKNMR